MGYVPCFRPPARKRIVTQYDKDIVEKPAWSSSTLGLKTLTVIQTCPIRTAEARRAKPLDLALIKLDDAESPMIPKADVTGVFQLESRAELRKS